MMSLTGQCRLYYVFSKFSLRIVQNTLLRAFEHVQSARGSSKTTQTILRPYRFLLSFCHIVQVLTAFTSYFEDVVRTCTSVTGF